MDLDPGKERFPKEAKYGFTISRRWTFPSGIWHFTRQSEARREIRHPILVRHEVTSHGFASGERVVPLQLTRASIACQ